MSKFVISLTANSYERNIFEIKKLIEFDFYLNEDVFNKLA